MKSHLEIDRMSAFNNNNAIKLHQLFQLFPQYSVCINYLYMNYYCNYIFLGFFIKDYYIPLSQNHSSKID